MFIGRCGANVNMRGPEGETALHLAAAGGHHDVVKFLLNEGADVDLQDDVSFVLKAHVNEPMKQYVFLSNSSHKDVLSSGNFNVSQAAQQDFPI